MSILPEAALKYVGVESEVEIACDPVERGQVRRHAQAIGDEDPMYWEACASNQRYGGPVAQPFFPIHMFRRHYGTEDPVEANASDPDYDGALKVRGGLPEIEPLSHMPVMNGGSEIEFFRLARHGETVKLRARYASITEKETSKGPIILIVSETDYMTGDGELLARQRHTRIRKPVKK